MKDRWFYQISKLKINGFKSINSSEIELNRLNILVGANGSGKSNLIAAFKLLRQGLNFEPLALERYVRTQGGADTILHYGRKRTPEAKIAFWMQENENFNSILFQEFSFQSNVRNGLDLYQHTIDLNNLVIDADENIDDVTESQLEHFHEFFDDIAIYHAHDTTPESKLKTTSSIKQTLKLNDSFSNLPAFLYLLEQKSPEHFDDIVRAIQRVAPYFQGFILKPEPDNPDTIRLRWKNLYSDDPFDVNDLSDGALRFIALTTVLLQPDETIPDLIILDEPELGLHPHAIQLLAGMLQSCSARTQIIAATQSVTLLNQFSWHDLIVTDFVDGASRFRRLNEEESKSWVSDYGLGELWEHNWLGGTPRWRA